MIWLPRGSRRTAPLFPYTTLCRSMMIGYDVVLPAGSVPTLAGLLLLVILVYAFQCLADSIRAHLLSRVSATIDHDLHSEIFELVQQIDRKSTRLNSSN